MSPTRWNSNPETRRGPPRPRRVRSYGIRGPDAALPSGAAPRPPDRHRGSDTVGKEPGLKSRTPRVRRWPMRVHFGRYRRAAPRGLGERPFQSPPLDSSRQSDGKGWRTRSRDRGKRAESPVGDPRVERSCRPPQCLSLGPLSHRREGEGATPGRPTRPTQSDVPGFAPRAGPRPAWRSPRKGGSATAVGVSPPPKGVAGSRSPTRWSRYRSEGNSVDGSPSTGEASAGGRDPLRGRPPEAEPKAARRLLSPEGR